MHTLLSVTTRPALLVASLVTEGRKSSLLHNSVLLRVSNMTDQSSYSAAAPPAASAQSARPVDLGSFPRDKSGHRMAERALWSPGLFSCHTESKNGANFFHGTRSASAQISSQLYIRMAKNLF